LLLVSPRGPIHRTLQRLTPLSSIHGALGALVVALFFCTCKREEAPIGAGVVVGAVVLEAVVVVEANVHADVDVHAYEDVDVDAD